MSIPQPLHLSPSSASTYDDCPRRWRFKYIDKLPEPPSEPALVGNFAHEVLEQLCDLPDQERTVERAKAIAASTWPEFELGRNFGELGLDDDAKRAFRWKGWLAITGLWTIEDPTTIDVIATERKVQVDLGDVPFLGIVDRVERDHDALVVSDYKSGSVPKPRYRDDKVQQVMLYAAALEAMENEQPERVKLMYLGQETISNTVTDRKIEAAVGKLNHTWSDLATSCTSGDFDASTGPLCGWCPYAAQCDEGFSYLKGRFDKGTLQAHAPAIGLFTSA